METLADFGTVNFFAVDTFSAGIYRAWQGLGDRSAAARLALVLLAAVLCLVWIERRQRGRMAFHSLASRPARVRRLTGAHAWAATLACATPVCFGFLVPTALLLHAAYAQGAVPDLRLARWAGNTAMLSGLAVAVIVPLALALAYTVRLASARWVTVLATVAGAGYAVPGIVLGVGLLSVVGAVDRIAAGVSGGGLLLGGTAVAVVYA
jgi:iron(III) transport system permease protein